MGGGGNKVSLKEPLHKTMDLVLLLGQILYGPQRCLPAAVFISLTLLTLPSLNKASACPPPQSRP